MTDIAQPAGAAQRLDLAAVPFARVVVGEIVFPAEKRNEVVERDRRRWPRFEGSDRSDLVLPIALEQAADMHDVGPVLRQHAPQLTDGGGIGHLDQPAHRGHRPVAGMIRDDRQRQRPGTAGEEPRLVPAALKAFAE